VVSQSYNKMNAPITTKTKLSDNSSSSSKHKPKQQIMSKEELIMKVISRFFSKKVNLNKMLPIVLEKTHLSLRDLDHLVTSYAKRKGVIYEVDGKPFMLYLNYKSQLKSYKKELLDPFRRGDKILFNYDQNNEIETTVGQLNFFKWAITNN